MVHVICTLLKSQVNYLILWNPVHVVSVTMRSVAQKWLGFSQSAVIIVRYLRCLWGGNVMASCVPLLAEYAALPDAAGREL